MPNSFMPPWWAKSPHVQTILPVFTKVAKPALQRQRLELPDGDFVDLDWQDFPQSGKPIVVIIHGLEGSAQSHYARRILQACKEQQLAAVVHHHRSCSGEANRLARSYHSGDTDDLQFSLSTLKSAYPQSPLFAVGYSLGGNVLTKYQGEYQDDSLLARAVVVSAPLQLSACAKRLENGFSKVYQSYLIKQLQQKISHKLNDPDLAISMPLSQLQVDNLNTFYDFDDKVTAPLHGFDGVDDYYTRASGLPFVSRITKPTLIIHAKDDPFMTDDVIPQPNQLSDYVEYELHPYGGHVGFIEGGTPWKPRFYLERRILHFLLGDQSVDPLSADPINGDNILQGSTDAHSL
ncbi:alpha/beta hydrolase fold protein [Shewanella baltica OS183]|uniref:hydrolase n=1 Tax=Shewanella baltica TaxID=62322 RepID=UPI0001E10B8F|nr:hydrolase [Shewanella baltica]AEG10161.1 alpha/beta hydrolase fold protein [Shewanella baltica BA175]EHQ16309.1 alpha/beta hydrolase fold protein [Shewanella baltica OS183]